jgi:hypothetical protein
VSGKTPLELVFGRRPLPLTDIETLDPAVMSEDPLTEDLTNMQIQRLAIRAHMEARQLQDLRRDIARNLRPSDGPYSPGDKDFFWEKDHSKIKDTGRWVRGRALGQNGSMVTIETDKAVVRINQSKVRKDKDIGMRSLSKRTGRAIATPGSTKSALADSTPTHITRSSALADEPSNRNSWKIY